MWHSDEKLREPRNRNAVGISRSLYLQNLKSICLKYLESIYFASCDQSKLRAESSRLQISLYYSAPNLNIIGQGSQEEEGGLSGIVFLFLNGWTLFPAMRCTAFVDQRDADRTCTSNAAGCVQVYSTYQVPHEATLVSSGIQRI